MTSLISRQSAVGEITYISGIVQDFDRFKRTLGRFAPVTAANPLSFWSQIDIPNPLYLFKLEGDRRTDPPKPYHRSPTIGKILRPTTPSTGFTPLHSSSHQNNISTGIFCLQVLVIGIIWVTAFCVRSTFFLPSFQINQHEYNGAISQTVK